MAAAAISGVVTLIRVAAETRVGGKEEENNKEDKEELW